MAEQRPRNLPPLPAASISLRTRIAFAVKLWIFKFVVSTYIWCFETFRKNPDIKPTFIRRYPCRPTLPVRLFIPSTFRENGIKSDTAKLTPLYINIHGGGFAIHGGGFAIGDAAFDDGFCTDWYKRSGMIVASLNYSKTPLHPFPTAIHDIASIAAAIIDDKTLPIDKTSVIIGGFSAGGNLCLSACLLPQLSGRIKAAIPYYPIVDWSSPPHTKFATRLCTERASDSLASLAPSLDWGYVTAGQDRRAKLLSPCYASRDELPPNICMIGVQHDMLCREARDMIYSLAQKDVSDGDWKAGFEYGRYKWIYVDKVKHGFTNDFGQPQGIRADARREIANRVYADVHRWLVEKVGV